MKKLLILGIGNPYVSDDGVGIHVTREINRKIRDTRIDFKEFYSNGFDALGLLEGYESAVIIDAAKTGIVPVGQLQILSQQQMSALTRPYSLHTFGFLSAVRLGSILSLQIPDSITIFAVEVADTENFNESCTPEITAAIPKITDVILEYIKTKIPDIHLTEDDSEFKKINIDCEEKNE